MGRDWDQFRKCVGGLPPSASLRRVVAAALFGACLGSAASPVQAGETREAAFGALVLHWDADAWSVAGLESGFQASCLVPACKGRVVLGSVATGTACEPPVTERRHDLRETLLQSGPLRWRVSRWWLGCRNAHPQSVDACTVHDGRVHRVSAPLLTCRTGPGHGGEAEILSLVRGIVP